MIRVLVRDGTKTATFPAESITGALEIAKQAYPRVLHWERTSSVIGGRLITAYRDTAARGRRIVSIESPDPHPPVQAPPMVVSPGRRRPA